jgi:hypothetical protein
MNSCPSIDFCNVANGGCPEKAICSHDPQTFEGVCRCEVGYINVGTVEKVVCVGQCQVFFNFLVSVRHV